MEVVQSVFPSLLTDDTLSLSVYNVIGNSPRVFAHCPKPCCSLLGKVVTNAVSHDWAVTLSCSCTSPETIWYICKECVKQRVHLTSRTQLKTHSIQYHREKKRKFDTGMILVQESSAQQPSLGVQSNEAIVINENSHDDSFGDFVGDSIDNFDDTGAVSGDIEYGTAAFGQIPFCLNYLSKTASNFFYHENVGGNGLAYLVCLATTNNEQLLSMMDPSDVDLVYKIANLCLNISRFDRNILCTIFGMLHKKYNRMAIQNINDGTTVTRYSIATKIPTMPSTLRCQITDGKNAFLPNIPLPMFEVVDKHVYVSIRSCLAYLMAFGIPLINLDAMNGMDAPVVQQLYQSKIIKEFVTKSQNLHSSSKYDITTYAIEWSDSFDPNTSTKNNRGSVYVKSITFARPPDSSFPSSCYTFPVCIGPSKASHYEVEKRLKVELESFKTTSPLIFFDGLSKSNKSVYLDLICSLQDQPERRSSCYLLMGNAKFCPRWGVSLNYYEMHDKIRSCSICVENLLKGSNVMNECSKCVSWDDNFSNDLLKFDPPKGYPSNCPFLTNDGKLRPKNITSNMLRGVVQCILNHLKTDSWTLKEAELCMNVHGINAEFSKQLLDYTTKTDLNSVNLETVESTIIPITWLRSIDISNHVEATMHLLFLGIVKTILMNTNSMLKEMKKMTSFVENIDQYLKPIQKLLLPWCKMAPFGTGKFGGHVSENYLAMGRIIKWYSCIVGLFVDGNAFHELYNNLVNVIASLYAMLSRILQRSVTKELCQSSLRHIKIFLNYYALFDDLLNGVENLGWIKKYNFLSLLNLPVQMQNYGPLLNLWEGSSMGEKIISTLKPEIVSGLRKNWQQNLYKKVMKKGFFHVVEIKRQNTINQVKFHKERYTCVAEIWNAISKNEPIVCEYDSTFSELMIRFENGEIYGANVEGNNVVLLNHCYFHLVAWEKVVEKADHLVFTNDTLIECLLLPLLEHNVVERQPDLSENMNYYYIITADWREFDQHFKPSLAKIETVVYNEEY